MLLEAGPELGRPLADPRPPLPAERPQGTAARLAGRSEIRILYIFDPRRNAVLLAAGDKAGKWEAWYRRAIPLAEQRYEDYLKQGDI
ncbi:MAG TPA: type II toxin-antitoxin system RelE/ParE family toxin [Streptosporangiaceae bacterium]|nr:type II toxin-antitoxin system RelE/ParE family toxin [Streptosporangiaceae bacterium]